MRFSISGASVALAAVVAFASPVAAQTKPSIAIMPTSYFSADAQSAENVTQGLIQQFEGQGYRILPMDQAKSTWQSMNLSSTEHHADRVAVRFGRSIGSDLVAYPRLLAVGIPLADGMKGPDSLEPAAVIHLRVLNVHTGAPIFFRQISHEFSTQPALTAAEFRLPEPVATATAREVTEMYFQRVAGSRQEFRRGR